MTSSGGATVLIVILVRDKAHTLPVFLKCIELQTWPRSQTGIYIRENDSSDASAKILQKWANKHRSSYREIYEDYSSIPGVADESSSEWTANRFSTLAKIRRKSIEFADSNGYDAYFVVDADNFIRQKVLENLMALRSLGVVAPYLRKPGFLYSNYHFWVDSAGYFSTTPDATHYYDSIHNQTVRGIIECQVVHCTYLISREFYDLSWYEDGSSAYEYVIFSRNLRAVGVKQYLDNREVWGALTIKRNDVDLEKHERRQLLEHAGLIENRELILAAKDLEQWLNAELSSQESQLINSTESEKQNNSN